MTLRRHFTYSQSGCSKQPSQPPLVYQARPIAASAGMLGLSRHRRRFTADLPTNALAPNGDRFVRHHLGLTRNPLCALDQSSPENQALHLIA